MPHLPGYTALTTRMQSAERLCQDPMHEAQDSECCWDRLLEHLAHIKTNTRPELLQFAKDGEHAALDF